MTAPETTFTSLLVQGIAQLLDTAVTDFTWSLTGAYASTATGIGVMTFPLDCPRAVAVSPYPLSSHPTLAQSLVGIQIKSRSPGQDPFAAMAMDDQVQDAFTGRFPLRLPTGIRISSLVWTSGGSLGYDNGPQAWVWASNLTASLHRPGTHRI